MTRPVPESLLCMLKSQQAILCWTKTGVKSGRLIASSSTICCYLLYLQVGLIDDIAKDKADAIEKCKEFIERFDSIPPMARSLTKQKFRQSALQGLIKTREADLAEFKQFCLQPQIQKAIGMYIQMLKQKK